MALSDTAIRKAKPTDKPFKLADEKAELIRTWKPWQKSTGPTSAAGKANVSQNAFKGGWREELRDLARLLREQAEGLNRIG